MQFNSTVFMVFLASVIVAYYHLKPQPRRVMLLLASYLFYAWWSVPFSLLMLFCTAVNWAAGRWMDHNPSTFQRRLALFLAVVTSLGILGVYKYANFISDSSLTLLGWQPWPHLSLILPLGISFYTVQSMSYCIDVYRGQLSGRRSLFDVVLFISFFPQLVAGPIVRGSDLLDQLDCANGLDWDNIRTGLAQLGWGMVKKVFIADAMAGVVSDVYGNPSSQSGLSLLLATYAFAVQIYCDFSGYSDIAIGAARMMGIKLPDNFRSPYLACSLRDFWRRWHITLSTWLRDYLYIPLGGSRRGEVRTYVNLMITMVLGGLWHGAGWHWVAWGALQGGVMSLERLAGLSENTPKSPAVRVVRWVITFHLVCVSWVLFRAASLEQAGLILRRIFTWSPGEIMPDFTPLAYVAALLLVEVLDVKNRWIASWKQHPVAVRWATYAMSLALLLTFQRAISAEFIYFQF
ncbi:MAG: MBOAT family protein [Phycisphaeraceae bacterium]|nr:MBOAT family protein [Phycisphaeraceae bacterium]